MMQLSCEVCEQVFSPQPHSRARVTAAGVGALLGALSTHSWVGAVLGGGVAYAVAAGLDAYYFARQCPSCGNRAVPMHNGRDRSDAFMAGTHPTARAGT